MVALSRIAVIVAVVVAADSAGCGSGRGADVAVVRRSSRQCFPVADILFVSLRTYRRMTRMTEDQPEHQLERLTAIMEMMEYQPQNSLPARQ